MEKIYYTYEILCKINNKRYIGSRVVSTSIDILNGYNTSSRVVNNIIDTYGTDVFELIHIDKHENAMRAIEHEDFLLRGVNNKNEYMNINFSAGGAIIKTQTHFKIKNIITNECIYHPKYINIPEGWVKGTNCKPPSRKGYRKYYNISSGEIVILHDSDNKDGYISIHDYRKKEKLELKNIRGIKNVSITNGVRNKKIYRDEDIPDGWYKGITTKNTKHVITNGYENMWVERKSHIPDGWYKGSCHKVITTLGKFSITNGETNRFISTNDIIPDGWYKGSKTSKIYEYSGNIFIGKKSLLEYLCITVSAFDYGLSKGLYKDTLIIRDNI